MQATKENQNSMFYPVRFFPGEREVFRKKDRSPTKDWAEKNIYITKSSKPGMYKNINNPPLAGLLDILDRPNIRRFVLRKAVQTGGSLVVHIFMLRRKTQSSNTTMLVMADRDKIKNVSKTRLIPMMKKSPGIQSIISDNPDDTSQLLVQYRNGATLLMAWAGSESAVSSDPCEDVIIDEVDKYKNLINLEEIKDRTTTYDRTSKTALLSTPAGLEDPITVELNDCDVICDCYVKCPDCGEVQIMTWDRINYPGRDENIESEEERKKLANRIERHKLARYECKHCPSEWDDYKRNKALESYEWIPREGSLDEAISAGAQFPSWISAVKSLSKPVARWLRAQGYPDRIKKWYNNEAGEPHEENIDEELFNENVLHARRYNFLPLDADWQVPMAACVITGYADIQKDRIEYEIIAWGLGRVCWKLEYGVIHGDPMEKGVWTKLEEKMERKFKHESGINLRVTSYGIDTGYLATECYKYIKPRLQRRVIATKGSSTYGKPLISRPKQYSTKTGQQTKNARYGVPVYEIGTEEGKDMIFHWLAKEDPYHIHFPKSYDFEYFRQLTAEAPVEEKDSKGKTRTVWRTVKGKKRNESIDIFVGNLAVLEILNPDFEKLTMEISLIVTKETTPQKPNRPVVVNGLRKS